MLDEEGGILHWWAKAVFMTADRRKTGSGEVRCLVVWGLFTFSLVMGISTLFLLSWGREGGAMNGSWSHLWTAIIMGGGLLLFLTWFVIDLNFIESAVVCAMVVGVVAALRIQLGQVLGAKYEYVERGLDKSGLYVLAESVSPALELVLASILFVWFFSRVARLGLKARLSWP